MGISYISFVAIHVSDLERARRFWVDGLGFTPVTHLVVDGRSPTAVELGLDELHTEGLFCERDGIRIQLQHQTRPPHVALPTVRQQLGLSHLGIRVDDMEVRWSKADVTATTRWDPRSRESPTPTASGSSCS
jgi:catechol 2,3-dioxygenase-like lactoylglutathione lyase family enzyme